MFATVGAAPIQLGQRFDDRAIGPIENFLAGHPIIEKVGFDRIDRGRQRQRIEEAEERTQLMLGHETMQMAAARRREDDGLSDESQ